MLNMMALSPALMGAVSLYDADSLWLFDQGVVGQNATYQQVVDSTVNGHVASSSNFNRLSWVAGPSSGPFGGSPQAPSGHALKFTPVVTNSVPGTDADTVSAATFASVNATVSGNATMISRIRWDGAIPGFDDGINQWVLNNGLQGWNPTTLSSNGFLMGLQTDGRLAYYTAGPASGQTGVGALHSFNSSAEGRLTVGEWYDVAMVLDDLGTIDDNTGRVTFYLVGADGVFRSFSSAGNAWIGNAAGTSLIVGAESVGTGVYNQRKAFNGAMDYLALYDVALSEAEIRQLFAVPEPSRALLILGAMMPLVLGRRRH